MFNYQHMCNANDFKQTLIEMDFFFKKMHVIDSMYTQCTELNRYIIKHILDTLWKKHVSKPLDTT